MNWSEDKRKEEITMNAMFLTGVHGGVEMLFIEMA